MILVKPFYGPRSSAEVTERSASQWHTWLAVSHAVSLQPLVSSSRCGQLDKPAEASQFHYRWLKCSFSSLKTFSVSLCECPKSSSSSPGSLKYSYCVYHLKRTRKKSAG